MPQTEAGLFARVDTRVFQGLLASQRFVDAHCLLMVRDNKPAVDRDRITTFSTLEDLGVALGGPLAQLAPPVGRGVAHPMRQALTGDVADGRGTHLAVAVA